MKIKRSLVVLLFVMFLCIVLPVVAYAATIYPEPIYAVEQLSFTPLIYVIVLLSAVLFSLSVIAAVRFNQLKQKYLLIGRGFYDVDAISSSQEVESIFDYSQIETPDEFLDYHEQSDLARQEVSERMTEKPKYVPKHQRALFEDIDDTADLPYIRMLPEMKHARRRIEEPAPLQIHFEELDELLWKIS